MTPSAVSQQVRALEEQLGTTLFRRTRRSVALTAAGSAILPEVQSGFESLSRVLDDRWRRSQGRALTISVAPSFASKWLLPRLPRFAARFPDIELRISATVGLVDFNEGDVDLAIRFGSGPYPELKTELLFPEALAPMCAPRLISSKRSLNVPADLRHFRLIHDLSIPWRNGENGWRLWLKLVGETDINPNRGARFSLAELALQAAIDGTGVVLGRVALAKQDLAEGKLFCPFNAVLPLDMSYYLVMPKGRQDSAEIQAFKTWLRSMLHESEAAQHAVAGGYP